MTKAEEEEIPLHDPRRGKDQVVMGSGNIRWPKIGRPQPQEPPKPQEQPKEE